MKLFLICFLFPIIFMGIFTYFYFDPAPIYYLLLLPFGLVTYSIYINRYKRWREEVYREIDNLRDSALIKAIPLNYMCRIVAENGIGYIYTDELIFRTFKGDIRLTIPFSDILKVEASRVLYFNTGINILLKDGCIKKFVIEEKRQKEFIECMKQYIQ